MNLIGDRYAFEQSLCDMEESKNHETDSSDKYDNTAQVKARHRKSARSRRNLMIFDILTTPQGHQFYS